MLGKKFLFGIVCCICVTIVSCYLKLDGKIVVRLFGMVTGLYIAGQTIVDSVGKKGGENGKKASNIGDPA